MGRKGRDIELGKRFTLLAFWALNRHLGLLPLPIRILQFILFLPPAKLPSWNFPCAYKYVTYRRHFSGSQSTFVLYERTVETRNWGRSTKMPTNWPSSSTQMRWSLSQSLLGILHWVSVSVVWGYLLLYSISDRTVRVMIARSISNTLALFYLHFQTCILFKFFMLKRIRKRKSGMVFRALYSAEYAHSLSRNIALEFSSVAHSLR